MPSAATRSTLGQTPRNSGSERRDAAKTASPMPTANAPKRDWGPKYTGQWSSLTWNPRNATAFQTTGMANSAPHPASSTLTRWRRDGRRRQSRTAAGPRTTSRA